jgi:hypothetical protein
MYYYNTTIQDCMQCKWANTKPIAFGRSHKHLSYHVILCSQVLISASTKVSKTEVPVIELPIIIALSFQQCPT